MRRYRKPEKKQEYKSIIIDAEKYSQRMKEIKERINDLFDDVDIKDKHIFKTRRETK